MDPRTGRQFIWHFFLARGGGGATYGYDGWPGVGEINVAGGIPGPGAIQFNALLVIARCGDGKTMFPEECDDGNLVNGDGCDQDCKFEP